ncbi:MAG: phosphoenolpyruvate--protein phosphotransferase [Endomicrobium sp.]|jgi:phosphotransferase system enzyme I (PtsI)|nr:phosphoenolpyruvate--protein phosphotransferase [Endomicrobium sp.]
MFIKKNIILKGIPASSGVVTGKVFFIDDLCVTDKKRILIKTTEAERNRVNDAIEKTRLELTKFYNKTYKTLGKNYAKIVDVYLLILDDPVMRKDIYNFIDNGLDAEYAIFKVVNKIVCSFDLTNSDYFNERKNDIRDVGKKIIKNLIDKQDNLTNLNEEYVVVSRSLTPVDVIAMREKLVKGFATDVGGITSHMAIVARGLFIPAVVGLKTITSQVKTGDVIVIDGNKGNVILNPTDKIIFKYETKNNLKFENKNEFEKIKNLPAETTDKHKVLIFANINNPNDIQLILDNGVAGIGLYRTEFMCFNQKSIPTEKDHFENYCKVVKNMSPNPTVIRTFDFGDDKLEKIDFLNIINKKNTQFGLRAIRFSLRYPEIFISQLKGILMASAYGKIKIMYPMIYDIEDLRNANNILNNVKEDLKSENIKFDEEIEVGAMIEVPSAAIMIDAIAKEVDFISIGTNDLIQYTLAVDRTNESVADFYDPLHPAILRFIKKIIDESHNAEIDVSMCGEMAGDPYYTPILLGLGLDQFSVASSRILKIKNVIRNISLNDAKKISEEILKCNDKNSILKIINENKLIYSRY